QGTGAAATSDGHTIVYVSTEAGANGGVWKADADGRHATQLVSGPVMADLGNWVTVTPDDRQVVFVSLRTNLPTVWTVPLDGGMPAQLVDGLAVTPHVSPNGKLLVYGSPDPQGRPSALLCDLPVCTAPRRLMTPANLAAYGLKWVPDGRAIAYMDTTLSNVWGLPID